MELAMQFISTDKTMRNDTIQDLKDFNQQSLATQVKEGEQLVSMMPAMKKAFNLMGDDIVELSVVNESLKNQIGDYDEKWLHESKAKLLKDMDDEKRTILIMSRMKKTNEYKLILFNFTYPNTNNNIIVLMLERIIYFNSFVIDQCTKITCIDIRIIKFL